MPNHYSSNSRNSIQGTVKEVFLQLDPTTSCKVACSKISTALKAQPVTPLNMETIEALITLLDIYKDDNWSLEVLVFFLREKRSAVVV
ncbi:hypothetical protein TSMEX_009786 [Taenia solium]|eukprot:TsM_001157200 transcript=TsM_001157200 gene=TsM_001157200